MILFKESKGIEGEGGWGSEIFFTTNGGGGGGLLKIEPLARGAVKISSFKFQYLHPSPPPLVIFNELSLQ